MGGIHLLVGGTENRLSTQIENTEDRLATQIQATEERLNERITHEVGELQGDIGDMQNSLGALHEGIGYIKGRLDASTPSPNEGASQ